MSSSSTPVNQIYKRTEVIGRGKFGIVYKGHHRTTKQVVAIKVLNLDTSEEEVKDVQLEVQFLSSLKTVPNITHYYGAYLNDTKLWIIMDYCAGGSLRTLLRPGSLEEKYIGVVVRELLIALQAIHKQGVIHRDIKAANVLITNEGKVQLCDFGVAAQLTSQSIRRNTMAGTPYWMAPEVIMEGMSYDSKCDIWSLGVTIYEIATGNPPYCEMEAIRAMQMITKSKPARLEGREYSSLLKEIVALCLDENAEERLSAEELLKSKFVKFHKTSPTSLLREVVSRYLVWRDKKGQRQSMSQLMNLEEEAEAELENGEEIEVKWDFDSLSSNEYIVENHINVENLHIEDTNGADEFNFEVGPDGGAGSSAGGYEYDDGDDQFVTGYQPRFNVMSTYNNNNLSNTNTNTTAKKNGNTFTYNNNAASTLKYQSTLNRKDTPKSLLQLFEDRTEEEEEEEEEQDHHHHQDINGNPAALGLHHMNSASTHTISHTSAAQAAASRVQTPMVEIEIPNMDDMPATVISPPPALSMDINQRRGNRSRSGTTSSAVADPASANQQRKTLDPNAHMIQRRPTLNGNNTTPITSTVSGSSSSLAVPTQAPHSHSQPILPTMNQQQQLPSMLGSTSVPPPQTINVQRSTPSPNVMASASSSIQTSPNRLINSQPSANATTGTGSSTLSISPTKSFLMMKAIASPTNKSPLLQPLNTSNSSSTVTGVSSHPDQSTATSATTPANPAAIKTRKNPNLRLQMPTPTTAGFHKLLTTPHDINADHPSTPFIQSQQQQQQQQNDENVNQFGVNVSNVPMTMTPLTEKPPVLLKRKPTMSAPPAPVSGGVANASVSGAGNTSGVVATGLRSVSAMAGTVHPSSSSSTSTLTINGIESSTKPTALHSQTFNVPTMNISMFLDTQYDKEVMLSEIKGILNGLSGVLGGLEEMLVSVNE
ncbi:hypothetical protein WICPIJ_000692 [Wickerhamomyces pijperi]|uniref:non-specific serine/threonine protein kinase n=1 Tax=Wickerhamomyces pijperi TaxID=599730 RepID=A0A9P8QD17_WICPI|nr:hypothetical protein WICPIJ_000692 [Wickerhamomyces pijperi]